MNKQESIRHRRAYKKQKGRALYFVGLRSAQYGYYWESLYANLTEKLYILTRHELLVRHKLDSIPLLMMLDELYG